MGQFRQKTSYHGYKGVFSSSINSFWHSKLCVCVCVWVWVWVCFYFLSKMSSCKNGTLWAMVMDTPVATAPAVAYLAKTNLLSLLKPLFPYNIFDHILKACYFLSLILSYFKKSQNSYHISVYHIFSTWKIFIIFFYHI